MRLDIYHQSLRQWINSLRQISLGLVALFPLALPALALIPLLAMNVLLDAKSENLLYLQTLWAYLLLCFGWVRLQREGILASQFSNYLHSLPVSSSYKKWTDLGVMLYASNILIGLPLVMLLMMLYGKSDELAALSLSTIASELIPAIVLVFLSSYYALVALYRPFPWLSLLVFPLLSVLFAGHLAKGQWLTLWCAFLFIERQLPAIRFNLPDWPQGLWRLFIEADVQQPKSEALRQFSFLLLFLLLQICFEQVNPDVKPYAASILSFVSAVLMASGLLNTQRLTAQWQYYLGSLPLSGMRLQVSACAYVLMKALPALLLLAISQMFLVQHWINWILFFVTTLMGILLLAHRYLLAPIVMAILAITVSVVVG
nr:DUF6136 family protein [Neptunicella marina]